MFRNVAASLVLLALLFERGVVGQDDEDYDTGSTNDSTPAPLPGPPLNIVVDPLVIDVVEGESVEFRCTTSGDDAGLVAWSVSPSLDTFSPFLTYSALRFDSVRVADAGFYVCTTYDAYGRYAFVNASLIVRALDTNCPFECEDGSCVGRNRLCDAVDDCPGGRDEIGCVARPAGRCEARELACANSRRCVAPTRICDGVVDCDGGDDEAAILCNPTDSCRSDEFSCNASRCVAHDFVCDGVDDCSASGGDESQCAAIDGQCPTNYFTCKSPQFCVPKAAKCNLVVDCFDGSDEQNCSEPLILSVNASSTLPSAGGSLSISCSSSGTPTPIITWLKNSRPLATDIDYVTTSRNGVGNLLISDFDDVDAGSYSCLATSTYGALASQQVSATVDPITRGCQDDDLNAFIPRDKVYFKEVARAIDEKNVLGGCADIVVIVDESGSMRREHEWLESTIPLLEEGLLSKGVGVDEANLNRYGLFGFARNVPGQDYHVVIPVGDGVMGSADEFADAVKQLTLTGSIEDGYEAIRIALESYPFRRRCVGQFILVTDEDRDVYNRDLSYEGVRGWLQRRNITLNAILKQRFVKGGERALGVYYNGTAFVSQKADYFLDQGFQPAQTTGDTIEHYVALAFETQGAAWDLSRLRREGNTARAFTKAFINVKVQEIQRRLLTCYRCVCSPPNAPDCIPVNAATCPIYVSPTLSAPSDDVDSAPIAFVNPPFATRRVGDFITATCSDSGGGGGGGGGGGDGTLSFAWYRSDGEPIAADVEFTVDKSSMRIASLNAQHDGIYVCNATNSQGSSTSQIILSILVSPVVAVASDALLVGGDAFVVRVGDEVRFFTAVSGEPSPIVRWTRADEKRIPPNRGTSVAGNELTFVAGSVDDAGLYVATATNAAGTAQAEATLRVVVPLEISLVPDMIRAVLGDPVTISVIGNRDFGDGINISWSRADGSPLPSYVRVGGENGDQIVIPSVEETLDIVVTVIDIVGTIVTKSVTLNSVIPLAVTIDPPSADFDLGDSATYTVSTNRDIDVVTIAWTQTDGSPLPSYARIEGDYNERLVISSVEESLDILITVTDIDGKTVTMSSSLIALPVLAVTVEPLFVDVIIGESANFSVTVNRDLARTIVAWTLADGAPLPSYARVEGEYDERLVVDSVREDLSIAVNVTSNRRTATATATLNSVDPLIVSVRPSSLNINVGNPATLTVDVSPATANVVITWEQQNGDPLPDYVVISNGGKNLFIQSVEETLVLRVRVVDEEGRVEETTAAIRMLPDDPLKISVSPQLAVVKPGENAVFYCRLTTTRLPPPTDFEWSLQGGGALPANADVSPAGIELTLRISDATENLNFTCGASNRAGAVAVVARLNIDRSVVPPPRPDVDNCTVSGETIPRGESRHIRLDRSETIVAADIILIVDESKSMIGEHVWLRRMVYDLDRALRDASVGVLRPNRFGVLGFAASTKPAYTAGRAIRVKGASMYGVADVSLALDQLLLSGQMEDGYSAIDMAINHYARDFRDAVTTARQFILVTDEDRTPLKGTQKLTFSYIQSRLKPSQNSNANRSDIVLNVVVKEDYVTSDGTTAIGIDAKDECFVIQSSGGPRLEKNCRIRPQSSYENTTMDYTELAFETGGGAWSLNILRRNESRTTLAFTDAFVQVKVREITMQLYGCRLCECRRYGAVCVAASTENCDSLPLPSSFPGGKSTASIPTTISSPTTSSPTTISTTMSSLTTTIPPRREPLSVIVIPSNAIVNVGGKHQFFCGVLGGVPPFIYQWTKAGNASVLGTQSSLSFPSVNLSDGGNYTCSVTDSNNGGGEANGRLQVVPITPSPDIGTTMPVKMTDTPSTAIDTEAPSPDMTASPTTPSPNIDATTPPPKTPSPDIDATTSSPVINTTTPVEMTDTIDDITSSPTTQSPNIDATTPPPAETPSPDIDATTSSPVINTTTPVEMTDDITSSPTTQSPNIDTEPPSPDIGTTTPSPPDIATTTRSPEKTDTVSPPGERLNIVVIPSDAIVDVGGEHQFLCAVVGGELPFTYEWTKAGSTAVLSTQVRLRFTSVDVSDSGDYTCSVTDSNNGRGEGNGRLDVFSPTSPPPPPPLEVLIRPSDVLTVDVNTTVTYFVVHNGGDNVTITWGLVDGSPLPSNTEIGGDYGEQLRIIQARTTLNIVVRIQDTLGRIASGVTTLFVRPPLTVSIDPPYFDATFVQSVNLTAQVNVLISTTTITWTLADGSPLPLGVQIAGNHGEILVVSSIRSSQTFLVRVVDGDGRTTTATATVIVQIRPDFSLLLSILPAGEIRVLPKSNVEFVCQLTGSPFSNFGWTLSNGSALPSNAQVVYTMEGRVATLTITGAATSENFACSANGRLGKVEEIRSLIIVPLSVSILPGFVQTVNFGESAQFHLDISPIVSGLFVQWRLLNGDALPSYVTVSGTMNETIAITFAQETISFTVTVTSKDGLTLTSSATLEVRPDPRLSVSVTRFDDESSDDVVFVCRLSTTRLPAPADFGWSVDGDGDDIFDYEVIYSINRTVATLTMPLSDEEVDLTCSASNRLGRVEKTVLLSGGGSGMPDVFIQPSIIEVEYGESANFTVFGSVGYTVTWFLRGGLPLPSYVIVAGETIRVPIATETLVFEVRITRGDETITANATLIVRPVSVRVVPFRREVTSGQFVRFTAVSNFRGATFQWTLFDGSPLPSYVVIEGENGETIFVQSATESLQFLVTVVVAGGEVTATAYLQFILRNCVIGGTNVIHGGKLGVFTVGTPSMRTISRGTADVVFIVDESRSMEPEHNWIKEMVNTLERNLVAAGIGTEASPNRYGLVGFANPYVGTRGRVLRLGDDADPFGTPSQLAVAIDDLIKRGNEEDGYSAIDVALRSFAFRHEAARQFILVSDEARDILNSSFTFNSTLSALTQSGTVLNVVVKHRFVTYEGGDGDETRVLGLDVNRRAYGVDGRIYDTGMPQEDSGYETTFVDYVLLAFATRGGAWDLDYLRLGDNVSRAAFTNAFVGVKVREIITQLNVTCESCACNDGEATCEMVPVRTREACENFPFVTPSPPPVPTTTMPPSTASTTSEATPTAEEVTTESPTPSRETPTPSEETETSIPVTTTSIITPKTPTPIETSAPSEETTAPIITTESSAFTTSIIATETSTPGEETTAPILITTTETPTPRRETSTPTAVDVETPTPSEETSIQTETPTPGEETSTPAAPMITTETPTSSKEISTPAAPMITTEAPTPSEEKTPTPGEETSAPTAPMITTDAPTPSKEKTTPAAPMITTEAPTPSKEKIPTPKEETSAPMITTEIPTPSKETSTPVITTEAPTPSKEKTPTPREETLAPVITTEAPTPSKEQTEETPTPTMTPIQPLRVSVVPVLTAKDLGESVSLTCMITSGAATSFTWSRDPDVPLPNNVIVTENRLQLTRLRRGDEGAYVCRAEGPNGEATARTIITITNLFSPQVELISSSAFICVGSPIRLNCSVLNGPATIQWTKDGRRIPSSASLTPDNSILTINEATISDAGMYRCQAANEFGSDDGTADIEVTDPIPPRVTVEPRTLDLTECDTGVAVCQATGCPQVSVEWFPFGQGSLPSNVIVNGGLITMQKPSQDGPQVFICRARNDEGISEGTVSLRIRKPTPPTIELATRRNIVYADYAALIDVTVSGDPAPIVTWHNPPANSVTLTNGSLLISPVVRGIGGSYTASATNCVGTANVTARLIAKIAEMPVIDSSSSDVTSAEDEDVVLQCGGTLGGDPSPSITWRKVLTDDLPSNAEVSESGELTLAKVTENDAGTYECTATNFVGTATGEVTLTIQPRPTVSIDPPFVDKRVGSRARFFCVADGTPSPSVRWFKPGDSSWESAAAAAENVEIVETPKGLRLTIDPVRESDAGAYACEATNEVGSTLATAMVQVKDREMPLQVTVVPMDHTVTVPGGASFSCSVLSSEGAVEFSWSRPGGVDLPPSHTLSKVGDLLTISPSDCAASGTYVCSVTDASGGTKTASAELIVLESPSVAVSPARLDAFVGDRVVLNCSLSGGCPAVEFTWTLRDSLVGRGATLTIESADISDAGLYVCEAENNAGTASATAELSVTLTTPSFTGNSFASYPLLNTRRSTTDIDMVIRPRAADGLILYWAGSSLGIDDFLAVGLATENRVEFQFNNGDGLAYLLSEPIALGDEHRIRASRNLTSGSLQIDDMPVVEGGTAGRQRNINLNSTVFVGGTNAVYPIAGQNKGFEGCVQRLVINGGIVDLSAPNLRGNVEECK